MPRKDNVVKYTDRDFDSIKKSLISYAKRYYPDTYKDFSVAGFGAMTTDMVAYIGDILSFYLDYQANETYLDTALEFDNVVRLAKTLGYKFKYDYASHGTVTIFLSIPASTSQPLEIDGDYAPTIRKGTVFSNLNDASFILMEDVNFSDNSLERQPAIIDDTTGLPSYYAVKAYGKVASGEIDIATKVIADFERFLQVEINEPFITEILSVEDSDGNEYFEVDHLSQNVVYKNLTNPNSATDRVKSILKPLLVTRRFTTDRFSNQTVLQFGYGSEQNFTTDKYGKPENVAIQKYGRDYISSTRFDPTNLISNDKFGVAPSNTTLTIAYIKNTFNNVNAGRNSINRVVDMSLTFPGLDNATSVEEYVRTSIVINNDEAITGDLAVPDSDELRIRATSQFATQKRAVTAQDYVSLCYAMPSQFGAIKRALIARDKDSLKTNLNLYVMGEDQFGDFINANAIIKKNLKTWISRHKMISDTIDILDAKIVNIGLIFSVQADPGFNKFDVLQNCISDLTDLYTIAFNIGEPLFINDAYRKLRDTTGVLDVLRVEADVKNGGLYADTFFAIPGNMSTDGRVLSPPENVVFEIKYPSDDFVGTVM